MRRPGEKPPWRPPDGLVEEVFEAAEEFGISDTNSHGEMFGVGVVSECHDLSTEQSRGLAHAVEMEIQAEQNQIYGMMLVESAIQNRN